MDGTVQILDRIYAWLVTNGMELATNILVSVIILIAASITIRVMVRGLKAALHRSGKVTELLEKFTVNVVRKSLWIVAVMLILGQFGIDIGPLIAGLGVTGFILGFAFQETIGNLLAGVMLSLNHPFGIGEYVDIGGTSGTVKDMDMISVTLHTPDNKRIVMANRIVWGKPIINYTVLGTRRAEIIMNIAYGADITQAKQVIRDELAKVAEILPEPAPVVEVISMSDSSVDIVVRPWVETANYWKVVFGLNQSLKEAFDREGIEIPYPQLDVHHIGLEEVRKS